MYCRNTFFGLIVSLAAISCSGTKNVQLADERFPAAEADCFPGAYYRKAVTSFDNWTGISGVVILGMPQVDESRLNSKTGLPLDNFSVYMGGNAKGIQEVDAGLTWEFSIDSTGKTSKRRNAWRPFWRVNSWNNAPNKLEYIWHPGDMVWMSVKLIGPEKMRMVIKDMKNPAKTFQVDFEATGFTPDVLRQFKRVNAIDQSQNEGKPVKPTTAQVVGAEWRYTMLSRGKRDDIPMTKSRFTDMRCSDAAHIRVIPTDETVGAERIDIFGSPAGSFN